MAALLLAVAFYSPLPFALSSGSFHSGGGVRFKWGGGGDDDDKAIVSPLVIVCCYCYHIYTEGGRDSPISPIFEKLKRQKWKIRPFSGKIFYTGNSHSHTRNGSRPYSALLLSQALVEAVVYTEQPPPPPHIRLREILPPPR